MQLTSRRLRAPPAGSVRALRRRLALRQRAAREGSPANEAAMEPPIVLAIPAASNARMIRSATAIGSSAAVVTDSGHMRRQASISIVSIAGDVSRLSGVRGPHSTAW